MTGFSFSDERVALPAGAFAGTRRRTLRYDGRIVLGFTAGAYRPYLFPVYSPAGFAVTTESPADHPHHHSIWVGADHLHLAMPALGGRPEIYAYNCYVNDVFQGRAPGRLVQTDLTGRAEGDAFIVEQQIEWRGPVEWAAPAGRLVMCEVRTTRVALAGEALVIDLRCVVTAAGQDIAIGPTRHAWFNFRVAPSMCVDEGGGLADAQGNAGRAATIDSGARWVAASGPVGGGRMAGIALAPRGPRPWWWFVSDWGVATASPCRDAGIELASGQSTAFEARYVVHDGAADRSRLDALLGENTHP